LHYALKIVPVINVCKLTVTVPKLIAVLEVMQGYVKSDTV